MIFVETPVFTRLVLEVLPDEEYAAFQRVLAAVPEAGDLIRGGGGIRKIRWSLPGRGKSGGVRVVYHWRVRAEAIYLLYLFQKNERSDLSRAQVKQLAKLVKELK